MGTTQLLGYDWLYDMIISFKMWGYSLFSAGFNEQSKLRNAINIIFIIYKAQYPNMLKALYNKMKSNVLRVKTNINNNKYNCKINFQIKQM